MVSLTVHKRWKNLCVKIFFAVVSPPKLSKVSELHLLVSVETYDKDVAKYVYYGPFHALRCTSCDEKIFQEPLMSLGFWHYFPKLGILSITAVLVQMYLA